VLFIAASMAKSKNHTTHNQGHKNHRNGIRRPQDHKQKSRQGMDPKFLRNQKWCKKHNKRNAVQVTTTTTKTPATTAAKTTTEKKA
jgi:large subunit ribosomal protein L29e